MKRLQEIIVIEKSDRIILVVFNGDGDVIGINFMQGAGDYEHFVGDKNYNIVNEKLTKFYHTTKQYLSGDTYYEKIDQACWMYLNFDTEGLLK